MNFKEKINKLNVDAATADEVYALWGTTEKAENEKMDKLARRMRFKAKAEMMRLRSERVNKLRDAVKKDSPKIMQLRSTLQSRFAVNFRNLDQMSDEHPIRAAGRIRRASCTAPGPWGHCRPART